MFNCAKVCRAVASSVPVLAIALLSSVGCGSSESGSKAAASSTTGVQGSTGASNGAGATGGGASGSVTSGSSASGSGSSGTTAGVASTGSGAESGTTNGVSTSGSGGAQATTDSASTGVAGVGGAVVCGDVACPPSFSVRIEPPVAVAELPGVQIGICVDGRCSTGVFPDFELGNATGFINDASFLTPEAAADMLGSLYVQVYSDPDRLEIATDGVTGDELTVSFESPEGSPLGTIEGALAVEVYSTVCLYCTTTTFSNLATDE